MCVIIIEQREIVIIKITWCIEATGATKESPWRECYRSSKVLGDS